MHAREVASEAFVHMTSGDSAAGAVSAALKRLGREEEVIAFLDALNQGPLHDIDEGATSRAEWWTVVYGEALDPEEVARLDDSEVWKRVRDDSRPVVLWHGPHANERLNALRACWKLRHQPSRIHEVALAVRPRRDHGWPRPDFYSAVAMHAPEALADAWRTRAPVADVNARAQRWEELRARPDSWFRELSGDEIVHLPVDGYDTRILAECRGTWTGSMLVIGRVLARTPTGDGVLAWRVRELLASGSLEGRGGTNRVGLPEEVRPTGVSASA